MAVGPVWGRSDRQGGLAEIPLRTRKVSLWTSRISVGQTAARAGLTGDAGLTGNSMPVGPPVDLAEPDCHILDPHYKRGSSPLAQGSQEDRT